jgi:SAM-dependent methyltransferase
MTDYPVAKTDKGDCQCPERFTAVREVWQKKRALKAIYQKWYGLIRSSCVAGVTVEVGGGGGNFKELWPDLISSDIVMAPWLDLQADCHAIPLKTNAIDNLVGLDVLHHLTDLDKAVHEMCRVVRPRGRLVFVEPYTSPLSYVVRSLFHDEQVNMRQEKIFGWDKLPDEGNLAVPTMIFWRGQKELPKRFPSMRLIHMQLSDPIVYPLTGGFGHKRLLPEILLSGLRRVEWLFTPLRRLMAFKMLIVAEVSKG